MKEFRTNWRSHREICDSRGGSLGLCFTKHSSAQGHAFNGSGSSSDKSLGEIVALTELIQAIPPRNTQARDGLVRGALQSKVIAPIRGA